MGIDVSDTTSQRRKSTTDSQCSIILAPTRESLVSEVAVSEPILLFRRVSEPNKIVNITIVSRQYGRQRGVSAT